MGSLNSQEPQELQAKRGLCKCQYSPELGGTPHSFALISVAD